jgi:hypothetical protein
VPATARLAVSVVHKARAWQRPRIVISDVNGLGVLFISYGHHDQEEYQGHGELKQKYNLKRQNKKLEL